MHSPTYTHDDHKQIITLIIARMCGRRVISDNLIGLHRSDVVTQDSIVLLRVLQTSNRRGRTTSAQALRTLGPTRRFRGPRAQQKLPLPRRSSRGARHCPSLVAQTTMFLRYLSTNTRACVTQKPPQWLWGKSNYNHGLNTPRDISPHLECFLSFLRTCRSLECFADIDIIVWSCRFPGSAASDDTMCDKHAIYIKIRGNLQ